MTDFLLLRTKAEQKYISAKKNLEKAMTNPVILQAAAQEAQDAWAEFKKADLDASNHLTLKKIGDLYGH